MDVITKNGRLFPLSNPEFKVVCYFSEKYDQIERPVLQAEEEHHFFFLSNRAGYAYAVRFKDTSVKEIKV